MKYFRALIMLFALMTLYYCGCYTSLSAPRVASGDEASGEESWQQIPFNPSIPAAHARDFNWVYYYQLPWWMDDSEAMFGNGAPGQVFTPEEYRQRYPDNPDYSGSYSGSYSPTVTGSSLSKQPADSGNGAQTAPPQDNRRSFSSGSATNTQATVPAASTAPAPERREADKQSGTTSGREQPKRK